MKTVILICVCVAAVSWTSYADSQEEEFVVYPNSNSSDLNKYVRELVGKLYKELQDNPSLKLNETAINAIPDSMYVAVVVDGAKSSSSSYLVKVLDIKSQNKGTDDSSDESASYEFLPWELPS